MTGNFGFIQSQESVHKPALNIDQVATYYCKLLNNISVTSHQEIIISAAALHFGISFEEMKNFAHRSKIMNDEGHKD